MASTLLNCSICPKRPRFSDTSHLLTHVGSRGHLAHLHRLQVRSHQELSAGHQLAIYNRWYQQHGLGQLLSERMQQKESKTTTRRPRFTPNGIKEEDLVVAIGEAANSALVSTNQVKGKMVARPSRSLRVSKRSKRWITPDSDSDIDSDYQSSPIKRNRHRKGGTLQSSPLKHSDSEDAAKFSDADCPAEEHTQVLSTPENVKLKGVIWPGMDLFDAATPEMKRKRNQKKDGSIFENMERTSAMIEPTEVIYSPGGTMRKQRYIDGITDDSSLLEGATSTPKPPSHRKRLPLATVSSNISRLPKRSAKTARFIMPDIFLDLTPRIKRRLAFVPSSTGNTSFENNSRLSPTEDENMEFKLTVGSLPGRKKTGNFAIFNDNSLRYPQPIMPQFKTEDTFRLSECMQGQPEVAPLRPQLSFSSAPWLQPRHQLPLYINDPYATCGSPVASSKIYQEIKQGKESVRWTTEADYDVENLAANPLGYLSTGTSMPYNLNNQISPPKPQFQIFENPIVQFDDPLAYARNPLSAALGQFDGTLMSSSEVVEQRAFSPDGTMSDHRER